MPRRARACRESETRRSDQAGDDKADKPASLQIANPAAAIRKSNGYVFFFALAFFAAFFAGFSSFAFSAFTITGVLAARRIDRA